VSKSYEIRLSGTGGQGLILAGIILAEAALHDNKNAVQSQSYGPEARGGASKSEVIISDNEIFYPKVQSPDIFLALSQEACDKYISGVKKGGIVIVDSTVQVNVQRDFSVYSIPVLYTAEDKLGKPMVANIIALGAIVGITNVVAKESLEKAVLSRVPKGTEELNRKALSEGYNLVGLNTV
jgi:2-oxoglutarate ferredoxin oxidoreductase subunit gamma